MSKHKREKMKAKERRHQKHQGGDAAGEAKTPMTSSATEVAKAGTTAKAPATASASAASTASKVAANVAATATATAAASATATKAGQSASKKKPPHKKTAAQSKLPQQPDTFTHLTSSPEWQRFYREISEAAKIVSRAD
jgi:hypothetical protein